jgi:dephospho-CoA kinase
MLNTSLKKTDIPLRIGITGGIGSGKSLVCSIFKWTGIPVFEADRVVKDLYNTDLIIKERLIDLFGLQIYTTEGLLNRKILAEIIFKDDSALLKVNQLVHPLVREAFENWCRDQEGVYVLHEAAILFESGFFKLMDANILVTAPEELRIQRVMERDKMTRNEVKSRMDHQNKEEESLKLADFVILNDGSDFIVKQVLETDKKIKEYGKFR